MASRLPAAYPELFAAGAIIAGLSHGSAGNLAEALDAMSKGRERTSSQWGEIGPQTAVSAITRSACRLCIMDYKVSALAAARLK